MISNFLNKIFSSKIFFIAFSLLVAISLWMYVEISHSQEDEVTMEIPVHLVGEEVLRERDLFISAFTPEFITVTFDASSNVAAYLRGTLSVAVDVTRITSSGVISVENQIVWPEGFDQSQVSRTAKSSSRVVLTIDRFTSRQIRVEAPYTGGTTSDELVVEPIEIDPPIITVNGPEDILSRISVAYVEIIRENLSSTYIDYLPFILLDENGDPLDHDLYEQLFILDDVVRITVPITMIREVPLHVELFHSAGTNNENVTVNIEPRTIVLTGDPDAFIGINHITLGTVDMSRFGTRTLIPEVFNIIIPPGLQNVSGRVLAEVFVETIGLSTDSYSVTNINAINIPPGYEVEIINQQVVVRVRGTREDLDVLADLMSTGGLNIRIEVDLNGIDPNQVTHRINPPYVKVFFDGVNLDIGAVGASAEYIITVRLSPVKDE